MVRLWGMDANGKAFFQNAYARNLTKESGLLAAIESQLKVGDIIGVQYGERKARFKITAVSDAGLPMRTDVHVEILPGQDAPWKDSIPQVSAEAAPSPKNKRRFVRHKIRFPIELRDERGAGTHMHTNATDISGRGCYVEMLIPFPLGTPVSITFWVESEKVVATGIVRASDPGVGMGIEFTGLNASLQERFQRYLETLDDNRLGPKVASTEKAF